MQKRISFKMMMHYCILGYCGGRYHIGSRYLHAFRPQILNYRSLRIVVIITTPCVNWHCRTMYVGHGTKMFSVPNFAMQLHDHHTHQSIHNSILQSIWYSNEFNVIARRTHLKLQLMPYKQMRAIPICHLVAHNIF